MKKVTFLKSIVGGYILLNNKLRDHKGMFFLKKLCIYLITSPPLKYIWFFESKEEEEE
jgi:hypothetical protein